MDELDLAMKYGGFTRLDKVYLERVFAGMTPAQRLQFITPPPSVLNAYFAEIYQKQSPQAATDYYLELSRQLNLFVDEPSFAEEKPFVRLNLSGKSYGFVYIANDELARVFAEIAEPIMTNLLFELAQVFPHYQIFIREGNIYMAPLQFATKGWQVEEQADFLLTEIATNDEYIRVSGLNQEEVCEAASRYSGERFYAWSGRSAMMYIKK